MGIETSVTFETVRSYDLFYLIVEAVDHGQFHCQIVLLWEYLSGRWLGHVVRCTDGDEKFVDHKLHVLFVQISK